MPGTEKTRVIVDTDVGQDPDDAIALLFLCSRVDVDLLAVTLWPGDADQVAFARFLMSECGRPDVRVGARAQRAASGGCSISGCHVDLIEAHGATGRAQPDGEPEAIAAAALAEHPDAVLLTIGPLGNVAHLVEHSDVLIETTVSMGCYWGAPGQPYSAREHNFNGCPEATAAFLASPSVGRRLFVSKNVTHSVFYDDELHDRVEDAGKSNSAMSLIAELMTLHRHPNKKLHDPLAAATMLDESIVEWLEGQPFEQGRRWGFVAQPGTDTHISTAVDIERFREAFLEAGRS